MPRPALWMLALLACGPRAEPTPARPGPIAVPPDAALEPDAATATADVCEPYDRLNPACKTDCRGADCRCPFPDPENPACWGKLPCPNPPDPRIRACGLGCPTFPDPDHPNPDCRGATAVTAQVIQHDDHRIVRIGTGSDSGVKRSWIATLLRGDSDQPLDNGTIEIVRVDRRFTVGIVRVPRAVVIANTRVRLRPP